MSSPRRPGVGLIEVLVVVVVIVAVVGVGVAWLVTRGARDEARTTMCMHNLSMLARAHISYETRNRRLPGYVNSVGDRHREASWCVALFPYMGMQPLYDEWQSAAPADTRDYLADYPDLDIFVCPSDETAAGNAPLSYAANGGWIGDEPRRENRANGVVHNHYPPAPGPFDPSMAAIVNSTYLAAHDGARHTLLMTENLQWITTWNTFTEERLPLSVVWHATAEGSPHRRINAGRELPTNSDPDLARPASFHFHPSPVVNAAFCDGSVRFISDDIDYQLYQQMMTCADRHADLPADWQAVEADY